MSKTFDRISFSLDSDLEPGDIEELVERSEYQNRSEYIRELIKQDADDS